MRRARALALAALLAVTLAALPACSDDAASSQAPAQESQEAVASAPEDAAAQDEPQAEEENPVPEKTAEGAAPTAFDLSQIPAYDGSPYVELNGNVPALTEADMPAQSESYSPLDALGRCGAAVAVVSPSTMPAEGEERDNIYLQCEQMVAEQMPWMVISHAKNLAGYNPKVEGFYYHPTGVVHMQGVTKSA